MSRIILILAAFLTTCLAFVPSPSSHLPVARTYPIYANDAEDVSSETTKQTLEDKMKSWEASEDEIKAASLGGVVPKGRGEERSDAFDVGLYILFPIMVIGLGLFAFFPILVQNIDVTSVGPPPTS
jgi:hypothetical protein